MRNVLMKKRIAAAAASALISVTGTVGTLGSGYMFPMNGLITASAAESSVKFITSAGFGEGVYAEWSAVSGAGGYNVYVDGKQLDTMLIRQYSGYMRADAVGLKAGNHTIKVVPVIGGKEDSSKAAEITAEAYAHDRSGYGFVNGSSSGAYNDDGTLKSGATVIYVTNANKDSVSVTLPDKKGNDVKLTGIQNILLNLKSNTKAGPVDVRFIGNITDPSVLTKGDLYLDTVTCGVTIEGIGNDATFNGFGLVMKNSSNVEVRNIGFMNCDSSEGDDCGLQQGNNHVWVHNCDFFYGDAGSDADQVKGDGALDTKTSSYVTHSYNHFWDNGKCNLQGMKSESVENCITYHHNWYDHSDSRHPRIRTCTVHIYNNYYDGNAKYGVGVTMGASAFVENNYFRNCKYPMLISGQGSDVATGGTFSGEAGGVIKSYGNHIEGAKACLTQNDSAADFDAYEASSRNEAVPSSIKSKSGSTGYSNFDTAGSFYSYTPDNAEDVPAIVTAKAGRVDGGDFKWTFTAEDDESYAVNDGLKSALVSYKDSITAIGSGFKEDNAPAPTPVVTTAAPAPVVTTIQTTAAPVQTQPAATQASAAPVSGGNVIYASPNGGGDGKSASTPTDVLSAIKAVPAGGTIYLLEGNYSFKETIKIEESNSGASGKYKTISAYPGAKVKFDFTGQAVSNSSYGILMAGSYWHFYGFEICNAGDNGMLLSGNNNIIEMMVFNDNEDTGLQVSRSNTSYSTIDKWPSNNLIKNCTSKNNCDEATMENADGFAAKLTCGNGNVFDGCMSYNNSDDGWDLYAKEATGPIGVVTIKNCIAFRNGFTEDGRGYGNCDGNGFKLGGGGVGTRHKVENCLAFENLNCGFTDNNNPKFGDMKNCTAYNNGVGGSGKGNYFVYRCDTSATFNGLMSYYNTGKVSKTNAPGIKIANDKFVGDMTDSIYYNSKYYYAKSKTAMTNGAKLGDIITPTDSDFITLSVAAMGTDFHTAWRKSDGSPDPRGFAETLSDGKYSSIGYHMSGGVSQPVVTTPSVPATTPAAPTTAAPQVQQTTTKAQSVTPVAGGYTHDFTANGKESSFYTINGNLSTAKGTVSYGGKTLSQALKIETATTIDFTAPSDGKFTLVFAEPSATIKIDGTKYTADGSGIVTADLRAGSHTVTKADAANLFYMDYSANGQQSAPTTTQPVQDDIVYGDANGDGAASLSDALAILQYIANSKKYPLTAEALDRADVFNRGDGLTAMDALSIQKFDAKILPSLPESYQQ
ncbi:right-handed parallel beta-helix repeat-containing protein [Ruminococcus sp. XPD3002]|uniref:pectate lyase family protein n=1 Tax=Ruminococcus sp. XPD3002 TaxID=1452269 RepID=UPI000920F7D5|nr:Pectate lyase [Ruminococcus flavefaciens]